MRKLQHLLRGKRSSTIGRAVLPLLLLSSWVPSGTVVARSLSSRQQEAVATYIRDAERLQSGKDGVSVEQLFAEAWRLGDLLMASDDVSIEEIPESSFVALQRRLAGIHLNREEAISVEPEANYFQQLAAAHGSAIDRKFFEIFRATFAAGGWPVYVEPQTDYSGCTNFGAGRLVRTYQLWTGFEQSYPGHYGDAVAEVIEDVEAEITSTCACGDRDSVLRELQEFAATFPRSPVRGAVLQRIQELESGTSRVRFHCLSG